MIRQLWRAGRVEEVEEQKEEEEEVEEAININALLKKEDII